MPPQPFFSVVIPTKNRPALLQDAIRSVLLQDFDDYELIVSDNFNDEETRLAVDRFLENPHLRYFRTDAELPMPAHWEFATTKAHGRYVLLLTDRSVLKQHSLKRIHQTILSHGEEIAVCSWRWSLFDDAKKVLFGEANGVSRGEVVAITSKSLARAFVNQFSDYLYVLPRGLNSCYRQEVAQNIREKVGGLFLPVSPDFTSAFLLVAHTPRTIHINDALFVSQGLTMSHGGKGIVSTSSPYLDTLGKKDFYKYVPIKAAIVENLNFNDFLSVQNLVGGNLGGVGVNWVEYFVACYRELLEKKGAGLMGATDLADMFVEWETALVNFDPAVRSAVKTRLSRLIPLQIKILLERSPIGPFLIRLRRRVSTSRPVGLRARHENVLNAAGFHTGTIASVS